MNKKAIVLSLSLAALSCLPLSSSLAAGIPAFKSNKAMTEYFWNEVFNKHNTAVIDSMVGADYKQHSPEFADGKAAFKNGVTDFLKAYPNSTAVVKHIGADGDLVFIPTTSSSIKRTAARLPSTSSASKTERSSNIGTSSRISRKKPPTTIRCFKQKGLSSKAVLFCYTSSIQPLMDSMIEINLLPRSVRPYSTAGGTLS